MADLIQPQNRPGVKGYRPSPEHLQKLKEGRERAAAARRAKKEAEKQKPPELRVVPDPAPKPPARERKLEELEPLAVRVLEEQLLSDDERVAQRAAQILLEHKWGKPTQRQEVKSEVSKIEYVTSAAPKWQRSKQA